jgi:hypothetical protein
MSSAYYAARQEDEDVNREITEDDQGDRAARQDGGSQRHGSQHCTQCSLIDVVGPFERVIDWARLIGRHASHREISVETTAKILRTHVEQNQAPIVRQKTVTHRDAGRRRLVAVFRHFLTRDMNGRVATALGYSATPFRRHSCHRPLNAFVQRSTAFEPSGSDGTNSENFS